MKKKILVCDDDGDLRRSLRLMLSEDYDVIEACDGSEAVPLVAAQKPDLVLLDVSMPGMAGLQTLKAYRAANPSVITIMLTGRKEIGIARRALELGAAEYVTKPFRNEDIKAEIQRLLAPAAEKPDSAPSARPWRVVP